MSDTRPLGDFVWYDYMARDLDAAKAFYLALFGWQVRDEAAFDNGRYVHLVAGDAPFGGMMTTVPEQRTPPNWLGYVRVADADEVVARAEQTGGTALVPARDIPETGRFAVLADPCGAAIALFQRAEGAEGKALPARPEPGHFCWAEHWAHDVDDALGFYADLFGWSAAPMERPDGSSYTLCKAGDANAAGMMTSPMGGDLPPFWLYYVQVTDADATVARAKELGASVLHGPQDILNVGRFAILKDPAGAAIGVIAPPAAA